MNNFISICHCVKVLRHLDIIKLFNFKRKIHNSETIQAMKAISYHVVVPNKRFPTDANVNF